MVVFSVFVGSLHSTGMLSNSIFKALWTLGRVTMTWRVSICICGTATSEDHGQYTNPRFVYHLKKCLNSSLSILPISGIRRRFEKSNWLVG